MIATNNFKYRYNNILVSLEEFNRLVLLNKSVVEVDKDSVFSFSSPKIGKVEAVKINKTIDKVYDNLPNFLKEKIAEKNLEKDNVITNINRGEKEMIDFWKYSMDSNCGIPDPSKLLTINLPNSVKKVVNEFNAPYLVVDFKTFQGMECSQVVQCNGLYGFFRDNVFYPSKFDKSKKFYVYPNIPVDLHFTEVEKELLTDKQQGYLSTRHKSRSGETHKKELNNMVFLDEVLADLGKERLKEVVPNYKFLLDFKKADNYINNTLEHLGYPSEKIEKQGVKDSQKEAKAPIFTYCKVNKNALEALALRAQYGHQKYNTNGADEDWQNFTRVANGDFEYANAAFRHALEIGGDENEEEHLISASWNAVSRLEIYLRNKTN